MEYLTDKHIAIAEANGISYNTAYQRFYMRGWSLDRAITEKPGERLVHPTKEELRNLIKHNITVELFRRRLRRGWSREKASTTPTRDYGGNKRRT